MLHGVYIATKKPPHFIASAHKHARLQQCYLHSTPRVLHFSALVVMVVMGGTCVQSITAIYTYYYQAPMLETVLVVGGEHIAIAIVVVGHICTQNVMGVHNTIYLL